MTATQVLYFNGPILTMDETLPQVDAVLTEGERIIAMGDEAELRASLKPDAKEMDLEGKTLLPAFIDPHGHFPDPGFISLFRVDLSPPPRGDCLDMATALERLAEKAHETPKGEWVMGVLFDNTAIAEGRMPTRRELDNVSTEHPIWVLHASGHNGVANSVTLERQGFDRNTTDPAGGRFGRDPETGELDGLIEGLSAMGEMGATDFLIDQTRFWQGFDTCRDEYLSFGVTFAQNAWASMKMLKYFASLAPQKDPGIDIILLPIADLEPELSDGSTDLDWPSIPYFPLGARKLFTDGAFQMQTAFLTAPYYKPSNPNAPCGLGHTSQAELDVEVDKLHSLGLQIHCHCNGDAGTDMFLNAVEKALEKSPRTDHRHTAIHTQLLRDDQLERIARLGVTVSFFSAHIYYWGDRHHDVLLGPERANRISPAGSAEKFGVRYTIHNDASVTPTRPIHLAHCAVNRKTASGRVLGESEKISVMSALKAQTIDAAWQVFQENERGSITVGKLADLVTLDNNPLDDPGKLETIKVCQTIRRGRQVYSANR